MKHVMFLSAVLISATFYNSISQDGCPTGDDDDTSNLCPEIAPLPRVGISQGQVLTLALDDYVTDPDQLNEALTFDLAWDGTVIDAQIDLATRILTVTGATLEYGEVELTIIVTDPDGCTTASILWIKVHQNRVCTTEFSYDATKYGSWPSLSVAGQFNLWSPTASPMTDPDGDGVYTSGPLEIIPGWVQYKFVSGDNWFQDPGNPYKAFDGGFENSEVLVPDCTQPLLVLNNLEADGNAGILRAEIYVQDGAGGSGLDEASFDVTVAGALAPVGWDDYERLFNINLTGLDPDKYSIRAEVQTNDGSRAEPLFAPIWIEPEAFDWHDATLYFAFTDRFNDGDSSNNSPVTGVDTKANYQGGDWVGLTQKIQSGYFDALGIKALWVSPGFDNTANAEYGDDGRLYSGYHGYWPMHPTRQEGNFGTDLELETMIQLAHAHGIRVLFDLVINHVHNQHPYWIDHQNDGWFNDYALCSDGNNWDDIPLTCWFADYLPDYNFQNPDALHQVAADTLSYISAYDIDGYRVDAVKHVEKAFWYHLGANVTRFVEHDSDDASRQFYLVGETFVGEWSYSCDNTAGCAQWLMADYLGEYLLDGQFDFPLYWQVLKTFARYESSMADLAYMLSQSDGYYGEGAIMAPFMGNHDVARFISHANGDISDQWGNGAKEQGWVNPPGTPADYATYQKAQLAYTFLATIRGVPLVYYGDEIGLPGAGDPDNRRMMAFAPDLSGDQSQTLGYVQTVFSLRSEHPSLRSANRIMLLGTDADVLVYGKTAPGEKAIVALNRSSISRTVTVGTGPLGISEGTTLTDALNGGQISISSGQVSITLPPLTAAIFF